MKSYLLLICSVIFLSGSCDRIVPDQFYFIRMRNNSSMEIALCGAYILPDTVLPQERLSATKILPGKSNVIEDFQLNDKKLKRFETEKVTLFILDEQIYQTVSWDTIRKYHLILKRYEIDRQDYYDTGQNYPDKTAWGLVYP